MSDDTRKKIISALGLSPHAATLLLEALDERYQERIEGWTPGVLRASPPKNGEIVSWGGIPHQVARCPEDGSRCLSCERRGWHIETIVPSPVATEPDVTELPGPVHWGVWCVPIPHPGGRKADWLEESKPDRAKPDYVLRATNEAIAAELNGRAHAKHWRYEARPVLADGSPGEVLPPDLCSRCGLPLECVRIGDGDGTGQRFAHPECYYRAEAERLLKELKELRSAAPNDTIRARFEPPSPEPGPVCCSVCKHLAHTSEGCGVPVPGTGGGYCQCRRTPFDGIVEHCLGDDCADKAACECLCAKCNPRAPGEVKIGDVIPWGGHPHRVARCADYARCLSCSRRGWHIEPLAGGVTGQTRPDLLPPAKPGYKWVLSAEGPIEIEKEDSSV